MPTSEQWSFFSLVHRGDAGNIVPTLSIYECKLNILWNLGRKGHKSIYDLAYKTKYYLPELVGVLGPKILKKKAKKGIKYHYPFVHKTVRKLQQKNLVRISRDLSGPRMRRMVELTFPGLILYLRESSEKGKIKYALKHYPKLLPFSKTWDTLNQQLGSEKVIDAFNKAVNDCNRLTKAKFKIRSLQLEFEGFLRNIHSLKETSKKEIVRKRDKKSVRFLDNRKATILRNSYIALLAIHDILSLSRKSKKQIEKSLPKLISERELAYFEKREISADPLFKGERLREFFPKYADIKFFFTGMFVEKLLWHEKTIEKKPETHDFEVEYIYTI